MKSLEILTLIIGVIALFPSASFAYHVSDITAAFEAQQPVVIDIDSPSIVKLGPCRDKRKIGRICRY
jgi:hypothetical protein